MAFTKDSMWFCDLFSGSSPHLEVEKPEKVLDTNTNGYVITDRGTSGSYMISTQGIKPIQPVKPITDSEEFLEVCKKQDELKDLIQASKDIAEEMKILSETIEEDIEELVDDSVQKFVDATEIPEGSLVTDGDKWQVWTKDGLKPTELKPAIMVSSPWPGKCYTEKQLKEAYLSGTTQTAHSLTYQSPSYRQLMKKAFTRNAPKDNNATNVLDVTYKPYSLFPPRYAMSEFTMADLYDQKPETPFRTVDDIYEELKEYSSYSSEKFKIEVQEEAIETAKEAIKHSEQRIAELKKEIVHKHLNPELKAGNDYVSKMIDAFIKQPTPETYKKYGLEMPKSELTPLKITVPKGVSLSVKSEPKREIIIEEKNENKWIPLADCQPKIGARVEILNIKNPKEIPDIGVYQGEDDFMRNGFHKIKIESDLEIPGIEKCLMVFPDKVSWRPLAGQTIESCLPEDKIFKPGDYFLGENQNKELVVGRVFSVAYNEHTNRKEPIPIAIIHTRHDEVNWIHGTKAVKITEADLPAIREILLS